MGATVAATTIGRVVKSPETLIPPLSDRGGQGA
jgi:hypothetical protein